MRSFFSVAVLCFSAGDAAVEAFTFTSSMTTSTSTAARHSTNYQSSRLVSVSSSTTHPNISTGTGTGRSETVLSVGALPMPFAFESVNTFFVQFPYVAAFTICGIKASAADFVAQRKDARNSIIQQEQKQSRFEVRRNLAFLFYGGAYQGCCQEFLFNHIFPALFGESTAPLTVLSKVSFDMLVVSPFLCLPVAYIIKGAIYRQSFNEALRRYINDVKDKNLIFKYWSVWGPVQCLTFTIIPEHFRITFIAFISFFWSIILSSISGGSTNNPASTSSNNNNVYNAAADVDVDSISTTAASTTAP